MSFKINSFSSSEKAVGSYEKKLSICLSTNGFSFSVTSVHDDLLAIGDAECSLNAPMHILLSDIRAVFNQCNISPVGYHDLELVVKTRQFVWVPQHLYDASQQRNYLEALCSIDPSCGVFDCYNETIKSTIVFSANSSLVSAFKVAVPGLSVRCQHDKLVNSTTVAVSDLKSLMVVNLRDGEADYCVLCNKKLQISNTFPCANVDEVIYHGLNLSKQFHLNDVPLVVALCGDVDSEGFERMQRFFPQMALYNGRQLTLAAPEMQHIRLYRYAVIL